MNAPSTHVATAAQRNQKSARGATCLVMPAPVGGVSAAAFLSAATCTKLK
jgi:hypothetical protein